LVPVGERDPAANLGTAVLGAGPAGLTAAHVLSLRDRPAAVIEAEGTVGGIAKTVEFNGYRFDLGGHRFYTKLKPVERLWEETLGEELLVRRRLSRIYFRGRFFNYPLRAEDVFRGLGLIESARCALSYLYWRRKLRKAEPRSFEDWVVGRFGRRLYDDFFRSYTHKVWGIPGTEIRAEWAAQRIQDFSLWHALRNIVRPSRDPARTMIEEFHYPRLGPGQMWEAFRDRVEGRGIPVHLKRRCVSVQRDGNRVTGIGIESDGAVSEHSVDGVISTLALPDLIGALDPPAPERVREAARRLRFRNLCLVALMTGEAVPFPDNWIYLHDPGTVAGRVQNFGAWSEGMVRPGTTCLGVEYFCFPEDEIWRMSDGDAVELAKSELGRIGLLDPARVTDGVKVLVPKAYPMYDASYREALAEIRGYLESLTNLQTCGRNGLHRYNNQDHSMWTAILAALNLTDGGDRDIWSVNTRGEYLERAGEAEAELGAINLFG
jgi:protoporphyrinogen oxidase